MSGDPRGPGLGLRNTPGVLRGSLEWSEEWFRVVHSVGTVNKYGPFGPSEGSEFDGTCVELELCSSCFIYYYY